MKPIFHHRLINGVYEDPTLFVRMLRERRAFLFDIGYIGSLKSGDLLKVSNVFVTHMHIDHFIGFDMLLRALLRRKEALHVYGPDGIIECIGGKLRGYTWNMIREYPLEIEVFGISGRGIRHAGFAAENKFEMVNKGSADFKGIVMEESGLRVKAANLSHGTQCLGFSLEEDIHINIDKAALTKIGLPVGPWLAGLKTLIRQNAAQDTMLRVDGKDYKISELAHIASTSKGQKISYITDISPEEDNVRKAIELAEESDTLYCEAYFLHDDMDKAIQRNHLTARMAGGIAGRAGVGSLVTMHYSPRYRSVSDALEQEAMDEFVKWGGRRPMR